MKGARSVDEYIADNHAQTEELSILRELALSAGLEETIKWGIPVFTWKNKNVAGIAVFKNWVAIWFFQGVLLKDKKQVLVSADKGSTKAQRQWRFTSIDEINRNRETIHAYFVEALQNQKEGKEVRVQREKPLVIPDELQKLLLDNGPLKEKFESFSPGKRREFADYIAEAKRADTKQKRLERIIPVIMEGRGLYDKYKR